MIAKAGEEEPVQIERSWTGLVQPQVREGQAVSYTPEVEVIVALQVGPVISFRARVHSDIHPPVH